MLTQTQEVNMTNLTTAPEPGNAIVASNKTQLAVSGAAVIGIAAAYAAGHGWLGLSTTDWTSLITLVAGAAAIAGPPILTRAQALKDTVGKMKNTTVVTDAASANALPANPDVVAATPAIVAAIKAAA
jgi:hypothetical protein